MEWTYVVIALLLLAVGINVVIETIYFIRMGICFILATCVKRKIHILEKCSISGKLREL